jgi:CRP/FNR family transcriptional regulator, dissimilatory nitrate respiration regulator
MGVLAPHDHEPLEDIVARLPLFKGLARRHLASLTRGARLARVPRGVALTRRGQPGPGMFAVVDGMLKLALQRADGAERVVRFVGPAQTFGEAAALLGRASAVDATALADSLVVVMTAASIRALTGRDTAFAQRLAALLAERMLDLLTEVEASELRPAGERLAGYLLGLAEPRSEDGRLTARLPATKTLVAARLGMKKETLSRLLHDLAERRLIEVARRDISILDRDRLSEIAGR